MYAEIKFKLSAITHMINAIFTDFAADCMAVASAALLGVTLRSLLRPTGPQMNAIALSSTPPKIKDTGAAMVAMVIMV